MPADKKKKLQKLDIPFLEWIASALGLVLVLTFLTFTIYQALRADNSGPDPVVEVQGIEKTRQGYRVLVHVRNEGGKAAAGLRIEGHLAIAGRIEESSEVVLDYLAAKSQTEGGLFFSADPKLYQLSVRAKGYIKP